jgi:hypothetical protein
LLEQLIFVESCSINHHHHHRRRRRRRHFGGGGIIIIIIIIIIFQLSAVIPPGFCVTVAALEMQMKEMSHLQEGVVTLQSVSSTSTELDVIQEQCNR